MDRVLNLIAVLGIVMVVSLVSFQIRQSVAPGASQRLLAAVPSTVESRAVAPSERAQLAAEYSIWKKPVVVRAHKKVVPVVAPRPTPAPTPTPRPTPAPAPPAPAPAAAPAPVPPVTGSIDSLISSIFSAQGSGAVSWALRVADCESGDNPNALSPGGTYMGLFQFDRPTWNGTPYASGNPFNARTNAEAAAWLYARRGPAPWGCS